MSGSAPRVLVTFRAKPEMQAVYREVLGEHVAFLSDLGEERRSEALRGVEVLVTWDLARDLREGELSAARRLRLIQFVSAGLDDTPFAALPPSVLVAGNVGAYAEPIAEYVLAMALALAKRLPAKHAELARGEFSHQPRSRWIRGATVAVLGFGGIGKASARLFAALGARIHAVNTSGRSDESAEFVGTLADLDRVLAAADVVVIALPLTRATRGLIGRRELQLMKPDAILLNVARGAIVDEEALFEHLRAHPDFAAGIDAWWEEPRGGRGEFRTRFPFFEVPNFLGSPHHSTFVPGFELVAARRAAENVRRFLMGEPIQGVADPDDYAGLRREASGYR